MIKRSITLIAAACAVFLLGMQCTHNTQATPLKPIQMFQPLGGETWHAGQIRQIKWRVNDKANIDSVTVKLSLDGGATFPSTFSGGALSSSDTSFSWQVDSNQVSTQSVIRVAKVLKIASDTAVYAQSGPFTVNYLPIVILQPLGGESYKVGDTVRIKWLLLDRNQFSSVQVEYSKDGGMTFPTTQVLGNGSYPYPDTSYLWTVASNQVSSQFVMKVRDYFNPYLSDQSAPFAVTQ